MNINDRYATATRSSNLRSRPETTASDSDVLGAAGLADRKLTKEGHPIAVALERLFSGDNTAAREIVWLLATWAWNRARDQRVPLRHTESVDIARSVLAWHRDGICRPCNGLGYLIAAGSPYLSSSECPACRGTKKRPFEREFRAAHRPIAHQVLDELDRELSRAGPAVMAKLAPRMSL